MPAATDKLVELLRVMQPSLAMYLADSGIWSYPGPEEIRLALADLVGDHRNVMDRAALILEEREVAVPKKAYPISFSAWHDVDMRSILPAVVVGLQRQQPELERLAGSAADAAAAGLAAEALKTTRHHLEVFKTIAAKLQAGLSAKPAAT